MNNFYLGFKGNVFSKIFMMVAVFMAMSGSLGAITFTAETVDNDTNGTLDYIKVTSNENIKFVFDDSSKLSELFYEGRNKVVTNVYKSISSSNVGTAIVNNEAITMFYLQYSGGNTGHSLSINYEKHNNAKITDGSDDDVPTIGSITVVDKAKPILMNVDFNSSDKAADTITLTFSEAVKFTVSGSSILNLANDVTNRDLSFKGTDTDGTFEYSISSVSGENTNVLTFTITEGTSRENYLYHTAFMLNIKDNFIEDLSDNNLRTITDQSETFNTANRESIKPKIISAGSELDLNEGSHIIVIVDEKLKNTDNIYFKISYSGNAITLSNKPAYTDATKQLKTIISSSKVIELRMMLESASAFSPPSTSPIKVSIVANGNPATDAIGNAITANDDINIDSYVKDITPPEISGTLYDFPSKTIKMSFTDAIKTSVANITSYLDISYTTSGDTIPGSTITKNGRDINIAFDAPLIQGHTVRIKTNGSYGSSSNDIYNYSGSKLPAFNKSLPIETIPTLFTYKKFNIDMDEGNITLSFDGVNDTHKISLNGNNLGEANISFVGSGDSFRLLTDHYTASLTDNNQEINITLNSIGKKELSKFLVNKSKGDFNLSIDKLTNITDKYARPLETNNSIEVETYIQDTTDPVVENWTIDLDDSQIRINFNIPIHFNAAGVSSNAFVIASGSDEDIVTKIVEADDASDSFGYFNVIDVGVGALDTKARLEDNKTTLTFELNDSFVGEILNDWNLSTSIDNAFLVIKKDNNISNINQLADNNLSETNASNVVDAPNPPKKLSILTATKGNVNILFTEFNGVRLVGNTAVPSDTNLSRSSWYLQTIPAQVDVTNTQIRKLFDKVWYLNGSGVWKSSPSSLNMTQGYWLKVGYTKFPIIRADFNPNKTETSSAFEDRISGLTSNRYHLIGITNSITKIRLTTELQTGCSDMSQHTYKPRDSRGVWDGADTFFAGEAMWIRHNCDDYGSHGGKATDENTTKRN